ncbi:2Fe-2S iron-sulfur cluster-binding protein [Fulvimarina sp. MAC3]|uniref:2Fe-2S iron-sulfur cluster-binding protein n=1 Tax=Fulvimarina sp. MAC3 TaxID=3148887 RepID=UPI0031FC39A4
MIHITLHEPSGEVRTIEAEPGISLMEVAVRNGIEGIEASCGGACSCATCMVYVDDEWRGNLPPRSDIEEDMLEMAFQPDENSRLACQITLRPEDNGLVVRVPREQC